MAFRIDAAVLVQALDLRVRAALRPTEWPTPWAVRSSSVGDHFDYSAVLDLPQDTPRDVAGALAAEHANEALWQFSDGVSEDAREPYGGEVTIDGDLLRVRFDRLPRSQPDADDLAEELDPIPLSDIVVGYC